MEALRRVRATTGIDALSPVQLRLLVGITALGDDPARLVSSLWGGVGHVVPLVERLGGLLGADEHRPVAEAVRRFLCARFPVPRLLVQRVAQCPTEHLPLLTECIAYAQGETLRLPDAVRARLRSPRQSPAIEPHLDFADHHRELDGAIAPAASPDGVFHWLERAYHLGRAGDAGRVEWSSLWHDPDQLIDRAWSLSVEHRDHAGAAALYRAHLESFPNDGYAWHYLAFNLDRSDAPREEVEGAYRTALRIEPGNPWWNSRLVTF